MEQRRPGRCKCTEPETVIRRRKTAKGAVLVQHQCLGCGLRRGQPLPHRTAAYSVYELEEFEPVSIAEQGSLF